MKLIERIKTNPKKTKVRVYMHEQIDDLKSEMYQYVVIGEWQKIREVLEWNHIEDYYVETLCVNSALDLLETTELKARVEYGAIIREDVVIEKQAVVLMGAIINSGSFIGEKTMIDMGAVIGAGVTVKENCHIGANAVLAGTLEPYSENGVVIEKNSFIGAGAVVLEGVHIGEHTIVGANAVVTADLPNHCVAVGIPAKIIKVDYDKDMTVDDLRNL